MIIDKAFIKMKRHEILNQQFKPVAFCKVCKGFFEKKFIVDDACFLHRQLDRVLKTACDLSKEVINDLALNVYHGFDLEVCEDRLETGL